MQGHWKHPPRRKRRDLVPQEKTLKFEKREGSQETTLEEEGGKRYRAVRSLAGTKGRREKSALHP